MKKIFTKQLFYFVFILIAGFKLTYADSDKTLSQPPSNLYYYSIDNIKLGELDTLKIHFPEIVNIEKIHWDDFNLFFQNEDIKISQVKKSSLLKNEMWYSIQPFDLINESFDSIPINIDLDNNRDTILFISLRIDVFQDENIEKKEFRKAKPIITKNLGFIIPELWTDPFYRTILYNHLKKALKLIISLLAIFLLFILFIIIKKRKKIKVHKIVISSSMSHVDYLKRIKELRNKNYIEKKEYKLFYTNLSEIFRSYIEFRFKIPALEYTSDDLIFELTKNKINQNWILNFLKESDLVKFAKHIPNKKEELLFINFVENFIKTNSVKNKER